MAKELACVFPLIGICSKLKESKCDYRCLTWLRYPCILSSFASNLAKVKNLLIDSID